MLVIDILEIGHFRNVIFETVVSLLEICSALLMFLTVSFAECVLLRCDVAILTHEDHYEDED